MISNLRHSVNESFKLQRILFFFKRYKSKNAKKKFNPCEKALHHFDDFYQSIFEKKWPSIRLALLSKQKYLAVINNYGDTDETEELLKNKGAFDFIKFLEVQKKHLVTDESKLQMDYLQDVEEEESDEIEFEIDPENTVDTLSQVKMEEIEIDPENTVDTLSQVKMEEIEIDPENTVDTQSLVKTEEMEVADTEGSLQSDLSRAQIDTSRLILPDSGKNDPRLHEFIPATKLHGYEEYIPESEYYKYYQREVDTPISIEEEHELEFPEELKVFSFDRGDISDFSNPTRTKDDVLQYVKVDGGDLLAAVTLGVQEGDTVLDMNTTTGVAAYCIFQTFRPKVLICITNRQSEAKRLFRDCFFDVYPSCRDDLVLADDHFLEAKGVLYDKILVDVPNTLDRQSANDYENNWFTPRKIRDRLSLPTVQSKLLIKAMTLARPGGTILYTTSTLSPIQNEGVVAEALNIAWLEHKMKFVVKNLAPALKHTSLFYKFGDHPDLKYGTLIVPFLPSNYGPRYLCKIVKKDTT